MRDGSLPRSLAIFPRSETNALLEAWRAYDAKLKAARPVDAGM